jgi:hypothetical protein
LIQFTHILAKLFGDNQIVDLVGKREPGKGLTLWSKARLAGMMQSRPY